MIQNKKYIIIILIFYALICPQTLNNEKQEKKIEEYLELFKNEKNNYKYLKKIKELLIEKQKLDTLIILYEEHIKNISGLDKQFERKIELLEIKIWADSKDWENFLYLVINDENINQTKIEYILHKLIQNKKIDVAYTLIKEIRQQHNKPYFFSKKLISTFKKNHRYKDAIEESILYLMYSSKKTSPGNNHSIANKIIIDQIFNLCDILLEKTLIDNFFLPISNKQFSSNTFLNSDFYRINETNEIEYIIEVYKKLIKHNIEIENSKLKLAEINYKILNDLDNAYTIYEELEKKSSRINIDTEAILGKIDILISKGYLDSAQSLIKNQKEILKKFTNWNTKKDITNQLEYKETQILFYKGNYSEMNLSLDSLIKQIELKDEECNDLLEVKTISLFFNQNKEEFKKYSSIQHKIKMNKSFESILELIQLMNTENMLINELAQFQYAIIELEKGNTANAQQIISSMNKETIFYELSLIINAEIEDHLNKNYQKAIKLYEEFIEKYPNSIYKENILKRLNEINKLIRKKIDS